MIGPKPANRGIRFAGGTVTALASAFLFGVTTPLAKALLEHSSPLLIAGILYLGSGCGLGLWRIVQDRTWQPSGLTSSDWPWLAAATVMGGVLAPALLMFGLSRSDAATASLLLNLEAVFSALLAWFVFREATSPRIVWGFGAILAGGILLAWPSHATIPGQSLSLLYIAGACLCWGVDNNLTRKISAGDSRMIAAIKGIVAGSTNTILALSFGATFPAGLEVAGAMMVGFLGYGTQSSTSMSICTSRSLIRIPTDMMRTISMIIPAHGTEASPTRTSTRTCLCATATHTFRTLTTNMVTGEPSGRGTRAALSGLASTVPRAPTVGARMNLLLVCMTFSCFRTLLSMNVEPPYAVEVIGDIAWKLYESLGLFPRAIARLCRRDLYLEVAGVRPGDIRIENHGGRWATEGLSPNGTW